MLTGGEAGDTAWADTEQPDASLRPGSGRGGWAVSRWAGQMQRARNSSASSLH